MTIRYYDIYKEFGSEASGEYRRLRADQLEHPSISGVDPDGFSCSDPAVAQEILDLVRVAVERSNRVSDGLSDSIAELSDDLREIGSRVHGWVGESHKRSEWSDERVLVEILSRIVSLVKFVDEIEV